jgi:hypothetical protein
LETEQLKRCPACATSKSLDAFNRQTGARDGRQTYCRDCSRARNRQYEAANREKRAAYLEATKAERSARQKAYYADNKARVRERVRTYRLATQYGITPADYDVMLADQAGRCKICGSQEPGGPKAAFRFAVDHCHRSGVVRALLCFRCNTVLGQFDDSVELLQRAIDYLNKARGAQ